MNNSIILVMAADDNYALPLAVALRSVLTNLDKARDLFVYVLDGGIKDSNKQRIEKSIKSKNCRIEWVQIAENLYSWARPIRHLSAAAYLRLLMPMLLPVDLSKVIYLDCDLIVNRDLGSLWDAEIGNNYALAVQDSIMPFVSSSDALVRWIELEFPPTTKYFNSGVLVINLRKWRTDSILEKSIEYIEKFGDTLSYADQEVLNVLFVSSWQELDYRWNEQIGGITQQQQVFEAFIIHFSSPFKPWAHVGIAEADALFFQYLSQTKYSNLRFKLYLKRWQNLARKNLKIGTRLKEIPSLFSIL